MIRKLLTLSPVVVLYAVNAVAAMLVAWGWHATTDQLGAVDTIVTGVLTMAAAFMARPVGLPAAGAAVITVLTAFGAFHLHWSPTVISTTVAVGSILLGLALHALGIPVVAANQGKTAAQLILEEHQGGGNTQPNPRYVP